LYDCSNVITYYQAGSSFTSMMRRRFYLLNFAV